MEACIAIGLVRFCLVALLGLFQVGLTQERQAVDQVQAAHILAAVSDEFPRAGPPAGWLEQHEHYGH